MGRTPPPPRIAKVPLRFGTTQTAARLITTTGQPEPACIPFVPPPSATSSTSASEAPKASAMVLQDLGRRINSAVSNLTREQNLDEKVWNALSLPPLTPSSTDSPAAGRAHP